MRKIFAKVSVLAVIATFAIGLLAPVPAHASEIQAGADATNAGTDTGVTDLKGGVLPTVIKTMFFIIGALAVIMIIYSGIRYVTFAGNTQSVTSEKTH